MAWTPHEVVEIARTGDRMARRIGQRFIVDFKKLQAIGLTQPQIESVKLHLMMDYADEQQEDRK